MLLIASCPITGIVGTTSSTCLLLTKHRQNTNKMLKTFATHVLKAGF